MKIILSALAFLFLTGCFSSGCDDIEITPKFSQGITANKIRLEIKNTGSEAKLITAKLEIPGEQPVLSKPFKAPAKEYFTKFLWDVDKKHGSTLEATNAKVSLASCE